MHCIILKQSKRKQHGCLWRTNNRNSLHNPERTHVIESIMLAIISGASDFVKNFFFNSFFILIAKSYQFNPLFFKDDAVV